MIDRYTREEMSSIWSDQTRLSIWLDIEIHACDARAKLGHIPQQAADKVRQHGRFELDRVNSIEREVHHDVIAFLTNMAEHVGEPSRFVHLGLTSSDVLDTAFAVQLVRACDLLLADCDKLLKTILRRAEQHRYTLCIGRSHGIHAEPTTFGLKLLTAYTEFSRNRYRLAAAREEIATGAISGAVGTFANVPPEVEAHVCAQLGLTPEPISTQVIPRDRHAMLFATFAVIAGSIERVATEIRHLQRTEVGEANEFFAVGQKGSSAMPHKRNPILSENLTGLARLVRGYAMPALENIALWHERDISHSAVERIAAPDATVLLDFALVRLNKVVDGLVVNEQNMLRNLEKAGGVMHSQGIMLALASSGISREEAYAIVQSHALAALDGKCEFQTAICADERVVAALSPQALSELFSHQRHLTHVDAIFSRVLNNSSTDTNHGSPSSKQTITDEI